MGFDDGKPLSLGDLMRITRREFYAVRYALRSRKIKPRWKVGPTNLYGRDQVDQVRQALREIDQTKAGRPRAGEAAHA